MTGQADPSGDRRDDRTRLIGGAAVTAVGIAGVAILPQSDALWATFALGTALGLLILVIAAVRLIRRAGRDDR